MEISYVAAGADDFLEDGGSTQAVINLSPPHPAPDRANDRADSWELLTGGVTATRKLGFACRKLNALDS